MSRSASGLGARDDILDLPVLCITWTGDVFADHVLSDRGHVSCGHATVFISRVRDAVEAQRVHRTPAAQGYASCAPSAAVSRLRRLLTPKINVKASTIVLHAL